MPDDLDALKAEFEAKLKALEAKLDPPPRQPSTQQPVDYTQGMSMPKSAMLEMSKVQYSAAEDLRAFQQQQRVTSTTPAAQQSQPQRRGSGWRDEIPLSTPPGVEICDRLVDAQDEIDKAELAHKLAKVELGKRKG